MLCFLITLTPTLLSTSHSCPSPLHAPEHHFPLDSGDCSKHLTKSSITELYPQVDGPLSCGVIFPGPSICEKHLQRLETSENDLTKLVAYAFPPGLRSLSLHARAKGIGETLRGRCAN